MTCPYGVITKIVDDGKGFGVTPVSSKFRDACLRSDTNENIQCSEKLNQANVAADFESYCVGQKSCTFEDIQKPNFLGEITLSHNDGECNDYRAQFFIQYTCE